jgi:serine phosphatase RsbU (regulator of sigma subunit)
MMPDPRRPRPTRPLGDLLLRPSSSFQRHRWVVLTLAIALEVIVILVVYWLDSTVEPLEPVGAGVVFVSVVAAGVSGVLVGLGAALVGVLASFLLLANFSTPVAAANAIGSAVIWCFAAAAAGLTVGYLRRQVLRREAALEQALGRSLSAREKMERVLDFSPQFHHGSDGTEVAQAICDAALETFGSDGAHLYAFEGVVLELLALAPSDDRFSPGLSFQLDDYPDLESVLREHRPSYVRDVRRLPLRGPALRLQQQRNIVSALRIPILDPTGAIGMLSLNWDHPIERPTDELIAIMQRFADLAAIVWQNALREEAQRQADTLRETLDRVLALAPTFHITGSREEVAQAICEAALGTFDCTAAALYRVEGDRLRVLARVPSVQALSQGLTFPLTGAMPLARDLRAGAATFVPDVKDRSHSVQPWPPEVIRGAGTRSALYVPIRIGPRGPRNLFVLAWDKPKEEPDKSLLVIVQRFADQAALALTSASAELLHARLEASLLPSLPLDHPRLLVAARYRTGEQRLRLGGDFVGAAPSPDGALHFVVGDVSGHGPDAAALGAMLRSTWRALILAGESIPHAIAVMQQVLLAERAEPNAFTTFAAGYIDLEDESLNLANMGHPPPLLITDAVVSLDTPAVPPLGFHVSSEALLHRFALPTRWSLLCYTDGLIDARTAPGAAERYGEERLKKRLEAWATRRPDGDALDGLLAEIERPGGEAFADDVAVLLISTKDAAPG